MKWQWIIALALLQVACSGGGGTDTSTQTSSNVNTNTNTTNSSTGTNTDTVSTVIKPPTTPTITQVDLGANHVNLTFTPPTDVGSSDVLLYTATCRDGAISIIASALVSPITVSGLTQQVPYTCTIRASNREINGLESASVTVNLPSVPIFTVFPSAPQNPRITAGNAFVKIDFDPPATDGGYPVIGYQANCNGGGGGYAKTSPIIVGGLRNGNTYTCNVVALNAQGNSAASSGVTATPAQNLGGSTPPSAVLNPQAAVADGKIQLSFRPPSSDGGSLVTSFAASCSAVNGLPVTGSAIQPMITIAKVNNNESYTCKIWADNAYGSGSTVTLTNVIPNANAILPIASPTSMTLGTTTTSLAADGLTSVIVQLKNADDSLYEGDLPISLSSTCVGSGKSSLETSVTAHQGMALSLYQPKGCIGQDSITASALNGQLTAKTSLVISNSNGLSNKANLGKQMFFDKALSLGGNVSCASCHDPNHQYFTPNQLSTPLGGGTGQAVGFRSTPTAAYAALATPFRFLSQTNQQGTVNNVANGKLGTPRGGLMWDGRASNVFIQAQGPFTGPHEMAHSNRQSVLNQLLTRPYLASYTAIYGTTTATSNPDTVLANIADAIGQFETEDLSFMPFNSKFDAVQAGVAHFSDQEANGQLLFLNPNKAACLGCHTPFSQARAAQAPAMFTDAAYRSIGVPRNWKLPYNQDASVAASLSALGLSSMLNGQNLGVPNYLYYDLGFCGPIRTDSLLDTPLCGVFRTPGLRNIALKGSYFHNGVFNSLSQVINFYINRDVLPQSVYRTADGRSADIPYHDLPVQYQGNVLVRPPFTPTSGGRLSPSEMQDLIRFLCTFTDGFDPSNPTAYRQPLQCSQAVRR